jgi:hypothetical protein
MFEDTEDHLATGSESLREFAENAGMDNPDQCWLLDTRDVWVKNPYYHGPPVPHPEDDFERQFTEWKGDSKDASVGCD